MIIQHVSPGQHWGPFQLQLFPFSWQSPSRVWIPLTGSLGLGVDVGTIWPTVSAATGPVLVSRLQQYLPAE